MAGSNLIWYFVPNVSKRTLIVYVTILVFLVNAYRSATRIPIFCLLIGYTILTPSIWLKDFLLLTSSAISMSIRFKNETIIIGNGPSVMRRHAGRTIDSFGTIVRINRFQTAGYEEFVGSRTDIWYTLHVTDMWRNGKEREPDKITREVVFRSNCDSDLFARDCGTLGIKITTNAANIKPIDRIAYQINARPSPSRAIDKQHRAFWSTGMFCISYFVFSRGIAPYLCGFDSFADGWHYYEKTEDMFKSDKYCPHDGVAESAILRHLSKNNKLTMLT